ncbi:flavoprotein reductase [Arthrobacter sp. MYb227]|uniref:NAD(P)/FAD-dependent oxidoreductase n=1 Tax=Arthrobacter sp. MYb227 TaxID=1848601 RepID=UPI000CFD06A6|nr:FAD/NAD(P)-binding oxidoreductase [Arthrobacter sp. MYb227]PQZ95780.1 flavoprotein reductase [Arthrobacter sp. MYb227]
MSTRVLVLGAGFGGLEVTAGLSERFGSNIEITLIERNEHFVFGFSKLDFMFGKRTKSAIKHGYGTLEKPGVRVVRASIEVIDPVAKRVTTDVGTFEADFLVVALGADLDPSATPGLVESGYEYYSYAGAVAAQTALENFTGGRIVIGVTGTPFKCPPAPSETALMLHDYLESRGIRKESEISLVMPLPTPVPPLHEGSQALLEAFATRGIRWFPKHSIERLDPETREVVCADGQVFPFDLFLGVPTHVVPEVVANSGMASDGWIPVDPLGLETNYPQVYAIGDVTSVGTPKAGIFAEGQGRVVVERITAHLNGTPTGVEYNGNGICYVGFDAQRVARFDVTFITGQRPYGIFDAPTAAISQEKDDYAASRLVRWLGAES